MNIPIKTINIFSYSSSLYEGLGREHPFDPLRYNGVSSIYGMDHLKYRPTLKLWFPRVAVSLYDGRNMTVVGLAFK